MLALDLYCGAGGASRGLALAGYTVVGVDIKPQPSYPYPFIQANALSFDPRGFDLIWASPPCQRYMTGGNVSQRADRPDLLSATRDMLRGSGCPWILENVPGAPMRADALLCGSQFGLSLRRHRIFESSEPLPVPMACDHSKPIVGVYGNPHGKAGAWKGMLAGNLENWKAAMGIDWMTARELSQAIPPAYSLHLTKGLVR